MAAKTPTNSILKSNSEFDEETSLQDEGIFTLFDEINGESCHEVINWILEQNIRKKHEILQLFICSEGGDVYQGFALIDIIKGSRIPIRTIGTGIVASIALLIFIAGEKGHRILTPNTVVLSHQFSSENFGKYHELLSYQKSNEIVSELILNHYRKQTGLSEKKIRSMLLPPGDVYMSSQEALEIGLCDEVKTL